VCVLVYVLRKINKNYLIIYKFAIIFNLIIKELLNLKNNKNIIILSLDQLYIYKKSSCSLFNLVGLTRSYKMKSMQTNHNNKKKH